MIHFRSFARHLGVTALTLAVLPAQAQQTPTPPVEALQDVIVTGSRIAAPNEQSTSPIQVLSSKYIESSGKTDISDLLTQLPQNFNNALGQDLGNGFEGFRIDGQLNENWHGNDDRYAQSLVQQFGGTAATGTAKDGRQRKFDVLMGANFADGKGNITAFLSYRHADPVVSSQRDFGGCQLFTAAF